MPIKRSIAIGIAGASGSIYAKDLIIKLKAASAPAQLHIIMSDNAKINWELELPGEKIEDFGIPVYDNRNFNAPSASGSAMVDTLVICPCSMGLIGRIAHGISDDVLSRAADVILKEKRKLILVFREMPLSSIHLRNLTILSDAGAIICPAAPSFYQNTITIQDIVSTVTSRIIDHMGFEQTTYRWHSQ